MHLVGMARRGYPAMIYIGTWIEVYLNIRVLDTGSTPEETTGLAMGGGADSGLR